MYESVSGRVSPMQIIGAWLYGAGVMSATSIGAVALDTVLRQPSEAELEEAAQIYEETGDVCAALAGIRSLGRHCQAPGFKETAEDAIMSVPKPAADGGVGGMSLSAQDPSYDDGGMSYDPDGFSSMSEARRRRMIAARRSRSNRF